MHNLHEVYGYGFYGCTYARPLPKCIFFVHSSSTNCKLTWRGTHTNKEDLPPVTWHSWRKLGAALWILLGGGSPRSPMLGQVDKQTATPPLFSVLGGLDAVRQRRVTYPQRYKPLTSPGHGVDVGCQADLWPKESFHDEAKAPARLPPTLEPSSLQRDDSASGCPSDNGDSTDTDMDSVQEEPRVRLG